MPSFPAKHEFISEQITLTSCISKECSDNERHGNFSHSRTISSSFGANAIAFDLPCNLMKWIRCKQEIKQRLNLFEVIKRALARVWYARISEINFEYLLEFLSSFKKKLECVHFCVLVILKNPLSRIYFYPKMS